MKPILALLQPLAVATAGSPISLPESVPFLSSSSWEGVGLPVDLANGRFGQLLIERRSRAGAPMGGDKAAVYLRDTDDTTVLVGGKDLQRSQEWTQMGRSCVRKWFTGTIGAAGLGEILVWRRIMRMNARHFRASTLNDCSKYRFVMRYWHVHRLGAMWRVCKAKGFRGWGGCIGRVRGGPVHGLAPLEAGVGDGLAVRI